MKGKRFKPEQISKILKEFEAGKSLLQGKRVTAFSNTEEVLVMKSDNIPYKLETRLKELGAENCANSKSRK